MNKILRVSSIYTSLVKEFEKNIDYKNLNYETVLDKVFEQQYSVSNNLTKNFSKKGYQCIEIINNIKFLQKKWEDKYGQNNKNDEILLKQIKFYKPNILFISNVNLIEKEFIKKVKELDYIKLIFCFHCAPIDSKMIKNLNNIDAVITCTEGYKKKIFDKTNKNVFLIKHAFSDDINKKKHEIKRDIDVTFIGSLFLNKDLHLTRVEIIYELMKNFSNNFIAINFSNFFLIHLIIFFVKSLFNKNFYKKNLLYKLLYIYFFSHKPIFGKKMYNIFRRSKVLVNMHIKDTEYAGNMRLFEGTGSGCLMVTDNKKDLDKLFEINEDIVTYNNKKSLIEKIKFYLDNTKELIRIAKNGRNKTLLNHNYEMRVNELELIINKLLHR